MAAVDDLPDPGRQHAAVGVAEHHDLGAGLGGGAHDLQRVRGVLPVAVEEVLAVDEDPHALRRAGARTVSVIIARFSAQRGAQRLLDVPVVALGHDAGDGARESRSAAVSGSSAAFMPTRRVKPKATSSAFFSGTRPSAIAAKNAVSLGLAPGQPPSMKSDAQLVQQAGDRQLVGDREVEALLLRPVAQGGVEDVELGRLGP